MKIKLTEPKYGNPPHRVCEICNDDGLCLNNEKNPNYEDDLFGSDIYDCCDYVDKGWMGNWVKSLNKRDKTPYVSNFVRWSNKHP